MSKKKNKKPHHRHAPRSANDPRVVAVLAVFDRFMLSPARDGGFLNIFMNELLETNSDLPLFSEWCDEAARAVVLAYVLNCPDDCMAMAYTNALNRRDWLTGWELHRAYEKATGKEGVMDGFDYRALGAVTQEARAA